MSKENPHYDTTLTDEYSAAVNRPADVVHDFRQSSFSTAENGCSEASLVKEILGPNNDPDAKCGTEPVAFVIRNVLTPEECDALIEDAEDFGVGDGPKYTARTAKRTRDYTNKVLSKKIEERIQDIVNSKFRDHGKKQPIKSSYTENPYIGPFYGVHTNWRILRYDPDDGSAFPAHFDQMDSLQVYKNDGSGRKDFIVSSHTFLVQLSDDSLEGGATRFYPRAKANSKASDQQTFRKQQFDHAVDVVLPRGWALAFRQRGMLHAGQPISASSPCSKYVAQAGLLRVLPKGLLLRPSVFKNGPGVTKGAF